MNVRIAARVISRRWIHPAPIAASSPRLEIRDLQKRNQSVKVQEVQPVEESFVKKFFKTVGWLDHDKTRIKLSGYLLYESVPNLVAYESWFKELDLPDTFASWFAVTELHIWLVMTRCMAEDVISTTDQVKYKKGHGLYLRNCIVEALWADVANRIKVLEGANPAIAKKQVSELSEQFQAALVGYDEGMSDDRVLAGALWRRLFAMAEPDAEHVEKVIRFIRKQILELDNIPSEVLIRQPKITWLDITKV